MEIENSKWLLVYTKAREEILAKDNLERQGFETFLPLIAKEYNQKSKPLDAIFPRYLFIKVDLKTSKWNSINSTKGVSNLVFFGSNYSIVPSKTIKFIKSKLGINDIFYPKTIENKYHKGGKLTIDKGKLAGTEGIFLSEKPEERVRLLLQLLKRSVIAEIPKSILHDKQVLEKFKL